MRSKGELVRRGSITDGGDVEFWKPKGTTTQAGAEKQLSNDQ